MNRIWGKTSRKWPSWLQSHMISSGLRFTLLLLVITVSACNKKETTKQITGEVFITTKGGDVVQMAGVQLSFYERSKLQDYIKQAMADAANDMPPFDDAISSYAKEKAETEAQAKSGLETMKDLAKAKADFNKAVGNPAEELKEPDMDPGLLENIRNLQNNILKMERGRESWPDANYLFTHFADSLLGTRTDSQGRYSITLPAGEWVVVGHTKRLTGETEEAYYWAVSVPENGSTTLSNYNLVNSDSVESVLHAAIRGPATGAVLGNDGYLWYFPDYGFLPSED